MKNPEATFDYRDERGELLFQVCRLPGKQFFQRRSDGNGGWINNLKGVRHVPYRLPDLIAGKGVVFIPEGEKHVDALLKLGLRATCNPGGAGKWRSEYNEHLRGQDVVILPDNDPQSTTRSGEPRWHQNGRPVRPGMDHALAVARSLCGVAARVRVLELPDLPKKGDVIDWLAAGGTKDELLRLAEQTPDWSPPAESEEPPVQNRLIQSSAEFVTGYVPPDYLIDGLIQRRFVYSMTAPTGAGKTCVALRMAAHVALGLPLAGMDVEKGRVLFFAGENPDDIRARWIKLCEEMGQDPVNMDVFFLPGTPPIASEEIRKRIDAEVTEIGPLSLLVVDTSAAYFQGDDENSNAQLGSHARVMRSLVDLPGGPTVVVTCHPTKNPNMDNLQPRGGGAFIAEMDGNLVCIKDGMVVEVTTHQKFRGPEFNPISFKLVPGQTDKLKDSKGRLIWTVTATPIADAERAALDNAAHEKQDQLLALMKAHAGLSLAEQAKRLGWLNAKGEPYKSLVQRTMDALAQARLVEKTRGRWTLTKAGKAAAREWRPPQAEMELTQAEQELTDKVI